MSGSPGDPEIRTQYAHWEPSWPFRVQLGEAPLPSALANDVVTGTAQAGRVAALAISRSDSQMLDTDGASAITEDDRLGTKVSS